MFVRNEVFELENREIGRYLRYDTHASENSLYNTPPMFTVWLIGKMFRWIMGQGGLSAIEATARAKASRIYDVLDASDGFYTCPVELGCRSLMNVIFSLPSEELTARFLTFCESSDLVGLKGHRSVGGVRASIYNAMPMEGVDTLVDAMVKFKIENE